MQTLADHVVRMARAGVPPLLAGTTGEGLHLAHGERASLVREARIALDTSGFFDVPIIVGTGGGSTRETVILCEEAAAAGADAVIVITPGYFAGVLANDRRALKTFFVEVAEKSALPVLIYNCWSTAIDRSIHGLIDVDAITVPGASAGIDLDSDLIVDLAATCPNLCGVKLTCVL